LLIHWRTPRIGIAAPTHYQRAKAKKIGEREHYQAHSPTAAPHPIPR